MQIFLNIFSKKMIFLFVFLFAFIFSTQCSRSFRTVHTSSNTLYIKWLPVRPASSTAQTDSSRQKHSFLSVTIANLFHMRFFWSHYFCFFDIRAVCRWQQYKRTSPKLTFAVPYPSCNCPAISLPASKAACKSSLKCTSRQYAFSSSENVSTTYLV